MACSRVAVLVALVATSVSVALPAYGSSTRRGAELVARGSVGQVAVTGAAPGEALALRDADGHEVSSGTTDELGAFLFRGVAPGAGYRVEPRSGGAPRSRSLRVLRPDENPPASFYRSQQLGPGYGYLTTRDGTTLAVNVRLPGPVEDGPYPTVIEYSGYDVANPDAQQPASQLVATLGYATVGVNLRGTGCSGGAWEYFETLQSLDGYDAVEAVAAQPWVLGGKVGMIGISYSGITQLFVAATQPPHLAAITPLSVIDDTYRGVLYPGGILNRGFAVEWAKDRQADARPAPDGGQRWARRRIEAGDEVCRANQALRLQTRDVLREIEHNAFYVATRADPLTPDLFADRIRVPTFVAGAWQDDETGGHWPDLLAHFAPGTFVRATITNGTHAEPLLPAIVTRWAEFLDFFVARRVPRIPAGVRAGASIAYQQAIGVPVTLPPDRFATESSFDAAFARYRAEPPVRVLFDNGAGSDVAGAPVPGFEATFARWPVPGLAPATWYLGAGGRLSTRRPGGSGADHYVYDPASFPETSHPSPEDDYFSAAPAYKWTPVPDGKALGYVTDPLSRDTVMIGPGSVDLWLRSSARDVDLEVDITEVRPDGKETYVQSGWLRASHRALDRAASTPLEPVPTHTRADAHPLPPGRFTLVRVSLFPFAHAFRAGSRVRIVIQAPGGNRPRWAFAALPAHGTVTNEIARSSGQASRVVLPVVEGVNVPTPLPACPSLRGQPCRGYAPTPEDS